MRTSLKPRTPEPKPVTNCATCAAKGKDKDKKPPPKADPFAGSSNAEVAEINDAATNHAYEHGQFSAEAAANGNTALAHNEAEASSQGSFIAQKSADSLSMRAAADPGNADLGAMAAKANANAAEASGYSVDALTGAEKLGPDPVIRGTPSSPSSTGYPGGPNPFDTKAPPTAQG